MFRSISVKLNHDGMSNDALMTAVNAALFIFPSPFHILSLHQTLKHLRTAEFKPYVVFVRPPCIERLRETRKNAKVISGKDDKTSSKAFSVIHTAHTAFTSVHLSIILFHPDVMSFLSQLVSVGFESFFCSSISQCMVK